MKILKVKPAKRSTSIVNALLDACGCTGNGQC